MHSRGDWLVLALAGLREDFEARRNQLPELIDEVQEGGLLKQKLWVGGGDKLLVRQEGRRYDVEKLEDRGGRSEVVFFVAGGRD